MSQRIKSFYELEVYALAYKSAMAIFRITKSFPKIERYSLVDQIRRSSRSVTANIAEAWHKRRYPAAFISKLNDAEAEAAETQNWIFYACSCDYLDNDEKEKLIRDYDFIIGKLVIMMNSPENWTISKK